MIAFCHLSETGNIGDKSCCPGNLGPWANTSDVLIRDVRTNIDELLECSGIVFGGGGLLHPGIDEFVQRAGYAFLDSGKPVYVWGAGTNYHDTDDGYWPFWLHRFTAVWLRDKNGPFPWCSCPSVLSDVFKNRERPAPSREAVVYEHADYPISFFDAPTMTNKSESLEEVCAFLQSGSTVITNSYHGALWSLWLNRKVILYKPFSNRFTCGLPAIPTVFDRNQFVSVRGVAYPDFYQECMDSQASPMRAVRELLQ